MSEDFPRIDVPDYVETLTIGGESLDRLKSALLGGDSVAAAVAEKRCVREPMGCGQPQLNEDGSPRFVFDSREEARLYEAEWRITGLCPTCQDEVETAMERLAEEMDR